MSSNVRLNACALGMQSELREGRATRAVTLHFCDSCDLAELDSVGSTGFWSD